ncbi:hypothetical protein KR018_010029, partial [Drosophila ironensis]
MLPYILYSILLLIVAAEDNVKVVKYENSVNTIVNDLIGNWESPIDYLKNRGYLPKDMQDAPDLDLEMLEGNMNQEMAVKESDEKNKDYKRQAEPKSKETPVAKKAATSELKKSERGVQEKSDVALEDAVQRSTRSYEKAGNSELKEMFQNLFASNDENALKELKSKLDVTWDINSLKSSARLGAKKYLEKFNKKRERDDPLLSSQPVDTAIFNDVSKYYPSLVPGGSNEKSNYNRPVFLRGVAKVLGSPELRNRD